MADRKIILAPEVTFQGETVSKPLVESFRGSSILLVTTGYSQSAALTALSGTQATSLCYSIPISNYDEVVLTASTSPVYVACAAIRPGSSLYFSTSQCKYVYENDETTFSLTCPIQWGARPFMTEKYATGVSMSSAYYVKDYQNLSATTYQNQKLALMTGIRSYFNFCNPTGGPTFITPSEMGNMYAPIQSAYYRDDISFWKNGEIDYWYGLQGYTVTFNQNGVYVYIDNNTPNGLSCNVELVAYEAGSYDEPMYQAFYFYTYVSSWGTSGGYNGWEQDTLPPGEIGAIALEINTGGGGFNFSASIQTSGMGTIYLNGVTDGMNYTNYRELSNDIEIQRIEIQLST